MSLRLIQFSDCHLQHDPSHDYRGINPEQHLQRVLHAASEWEPDALVLSGDLADQATEQAYQRLNQYIAKLQIPALAFPGNHDHLPLMQTTLTDPTFQWTNPWVVNGWQLVWLDSNIQGDPAGELDEEKLQTLESINKQLPTILFLHHQPVEVGTPWIDRFRLRNPDILWDWLASHPHNIQAVAWGHIHHGWSGQQVINRQTIQLYGAPSASACVVPGSEEFVLDPRGPRMRWFNLLDSGEIQTGLLSVN